jgi:hypothetical protein
MLPIVMQYSDAVSNMVKLHIPMYKIILDSVYALELNWLKWVILSVLVLVGRSYNWRYSLLFALFYRCTSANVKLWLLCNWASNKQSMRMLGNASLKCWKRAITLTFQDQNLVLLTIETVLKEILPSLNMS